MNFDEAGRLQKAWKAKNGDLPCMHSRVVDHLNVPEGQSTGKLVCKECGTIFPDATH